MIQFSQWNNTLIRYGNLPRNELTARDWISIIRPVNGVMGVVGTIISAFIGIGYGILDSYLTALIAALCVFLVTAGGNVINDIYDRETDRVNHPERPVASGRIKVRTAEAYAIVLFAIPIAVSLIFLSYAATGIVVLAELLLIAYESRAKRMGLTGNVIIGSLVGLIFIFGGIAVGSVYKMFILFIMAALTNIGREITKDIQDMEGDIDRKTFPQVHGKNAAFYLVSVLVVIAVLASAIPYLMHIFSFYYLIPVVVADGIFLYSVSLVRSNPKKSQKYSKYAMITGLLSFIVGELS